MKTSIKLSRILGLSSVLALSIGFTAPQIHAGPGIEYWTGKSKLQTAQPTQPAKLSTVCTDSKEVAVTETKRDWPNQKGPLQVVQVGTKRACTSCGTFTVMKPDWPNSRGPLHPVQVAGTHDCDSTCVIQPHS